MGFFQYFILQWLILKQVDLFSHCQQSSWQNLKRYLYAPVYLFLDFSYPSSTSWASRTLSRSINRFFTWVLTFLGLHLAANPSFSTLLNSHVLYSPNLQPPLTPSYSKHLPSHWPYTDDNQSHNRNPWLVLPIFFAACLTFFVTLNTSNSYDQ